MKITYHEFIRQVEENDGEVLPTAGGRKTFQLKRTETGVSFTPTSSGIPRTLNRDSIQGYLDDFNRTQSTNTSVYVGNHRNQSYVLTVYKFILGQAHGAQLVDDGTSTTGEIDPKFSAPEGKLKVRSHRRRERSRELVKMAKQLFRRQHRNRLFCEVCGFDFGKKYGDPDFIEAHHLIPLRDLKPGVITKPSDLVMVCANCHRMLHRGNPWPSIPELKQRMAKI